MFLTREMVASGPSAGLMSRPTAMGLRLLCVSARGRNGLLPGSCCGACGGEEFSSVHCLSFSGGNDSMAEGYQVRVFVVVTLLHQLPGRKAAWVNFAQFQDSYGITTVRFPLCRNEFARTLFVRVASTSLRMTSWNRKDRLSHPFANCAKGWGTRIWITERFFYFAGKTTFEPFRP